MAVRFCAILCLLVLLTVSENHAFAQKKNAKESVSKRDIGQLEKEIASQERQLARLRSERRTTAYLDAAICSKAADWIIRHDEFFRKGYLMDTVGVLKLGRQRIKNINPNGNKTEFWNEAGKQHACAYRSRIDDSIQPFVVSLPKDFDAESEKKWPLHVKLHGRNSRLTETSFIAGFEGKSTSENQEWIQLEIFGRVNNAYRWGGETDVFEAMQAVQQRYRIDNKRISLWGFSMGGAGAWHLGLHHPSKWASVGAGAGFVDFYNYQKKTDEKLPGYQDKTLRIYDSVNYALNNFNVPLVPYVGDEDKGLAQSNLMVDEGKKLDSPYNLIIGKNIGHKFTPEGLKEFMTFLNENNAKGTPKSNERKKIRFVTYTPKYNHCDWARIEELHKIYERTEIEGEINEDQSLVTVKTKNVRALQIDREIATEISIDGSKPMPLASASKGLLPGVYFINDGKEWTQLDYDQSREFQKNPEGHKRKNLQGPIDDAFMEPFLCVRGTRTAWSLHQQKWTSFTYRRFQNEYDKWMRAKLKLVSDSSVEKDDIESKNLILFGDPGSNQIIAKIIKDLPVKWTRSKIEVAGKSYDSRTHGLCMIFPNPLNPERYVVINSGYTMREKDFKSSNSWLFPKLGDIAVIKFKSGEKGQYEEETVWADLFDSDWKLSN